MEFVTRWSLKDATEASPDIAPDERLFWGKTIVLGFQHVVAMFGSTALAPIRLRSEHLHLLLRHRHASVLPRPRRAAALLSRLELRLHRRRHRRHGICRQRPQSEHPARARRHRRRGGRLRDHRPHRACLRHGLAREADAAGLDRRNRRGDRAQPRRRRGERRVGLRLRYPDRLVTVLAVALIAVHAPGMARRLPVLLGAICGYVLYLICANGFGLSKAIDFFQRSGGAALRLAEIHPPGLYCLGGGADRARGDRARRRKPRHVKAIAAMTGRDFDPLLGRAFLADGLATVIAGSGGGTGVTNYAENMGVMAVTRVFSTLVFVVAGIVALLLGFSPKFGALIMTLPGPVIGGLTLVVFGLIAATAGRIWVGNRVDFSDPRNLTAAFALTAGGGRSYCKDW